jgi:hypothetical protein
MKRGGKLAKTKKKNPAGRKLRKVTGSTGWLKASAVRFLKEAGKPMQVLIRRAKKRKPKKAKRR